MDRSSGLWTDAVSREGKSVMDLVTAELYQGGNTPPDAYYKSIKGDLAYKKDFKPAQRKVLECYNDLTNYNIEYIIHELDISLHWKIQSSMCGMSSGHALYRHLRKLTEMRNVVSHSCEDIDDLNEKLDELSELCTEILRELECQTGKNFRFDVCELQRRIEARKVKPEVVLSPRSDHLSLTKKEESSGLSGWEAAGIGALAAVGVGLLGAALFGDSKKKKENTRGNSSYIH